MSSSSQDSVVGNNDSYEFIVDFSREVEEETSSKEQAVESSTNFPQHYTPPSWVRFDEQTPYEEKAYLEEGKAGEYKEVIDPGKDLIYDEDKPKTRIILLKTSTSYEASNVRLGGKPTALIGFKGTFHCSPRDGSARFRQVIIDVPFKSAHEGYPDPKIEAILISALSQNSKSSVTFSDSLTAGVNIGFNGHGGFELSATQTNSVTYETEAELQVSGEGTSSLKVMMFEDPAKRYGVLEKVQIGILLSLGTKIEVGFHAELQLEVIPGSRWKAWCSKEKEWILWFDGKADEQK